MNIRNRRELLKVLIEATGGMSIAEITVELFGENNFQNKSRAWSVVYEVRRELKKAGLYFYAVEGVLRVLDQDTYVKATFARKEDIKARILSLSDMVVQGAQDHPELKPMLLATLRSAHDQLLLEMKNDN